MKACALCKRTVEVDRFFSRKASCPHCGGDLHICLNCNFYDEGSHNKCREPKSEFQRSRDKMNFCDFFTFRKLTSAKEGTASGKAGDVKSEWEALFKKES